MRQLIEPLYVEQNNERSHFHISSLTKAEADIKIDSLVGIIYRQTDPDMRMLNQILLIEGRYCIAISAEEAIRLGIPRNVYSKYEEHVKMMNEKGR